jgi:predicted phosphate transport protein (TIGR00153 family)
LPTTPPPREVPVPFLVPTDQDFFAMFERTTTTIVEGAQLLEALVRDLVDLDVRLLRLKEIEHEGDVTTHQTYEKLNKTFLTPFDREDLHSLAAQLDEILDWIEEAGQRFGLYKITEPRPEASRLAKIIVQATLELDAAIRQLRAHSKNAAAIHKHLVEINRLENEGDTIYRQAIGHLFEDESLRTITILKWKEAYDALESAIDACEHAAHAIDFMLVKHA